MPKGALQFLNFAVTAQFGGDGTGNWRSKWQRLKALLICALLTGSYGLGCTVSAEQPAIYSHRWLDQRYDWAIFLEPRLLKDYLKYDGSRLTPVTSVKISYRVNPRLAVGKVDSVIAYEDLWYHEHIPIGCHRYGKLGLKQSWQGSICVLTDSDGRWSSPALANAIVRLMLDVGLTDCITVFVFVPPSMITSICSDLGRFGFLPTTDTSLSTESVVHLVVSSGDPNDRVFLIYKP